MSVAAIATAVAAWRGIGTWRAQVSGKADFDLARKLGTVIYALRDAVRHARRPFLSADEFPDGTIPAGGEVGEASAYAAVFNRRYAEPRRIGRELNALRNEGEALWGAQIVELTDALIVDMSDLHMAVTVFISDKATGGARFRPAPAFAEKMYATIFDAGGEVRNDGSVTPPNAFAAKFERHIDAVAAFLRTKLPQPPTRRARRWWHG